jgi:branched-chain amino acid transport system ATP-binding protein
MNPDRVTHLGIARTFQNIALFHHMTVLDNLMLGRHQFMKRGILAGGIFLGPARTEEIENRKAVEDIIDFLEIENIRKKPVGTLPYGLRKRVELGRALALKPKLLLLDEPMAGTGHDETERLVAALRGLKGRFPMVLVEHDMTAVFALADRISVLIYGRILASGTPDEVRADPQVITAYLGDEME